MNRLWLPWREKHIWKEGDIPENQGLYWATGADERQSKRKSVLPGVNKANCEHSQDNLFTEQKKERKIELVTELYMTNVQRTGIAQLGDNRILESSWASSVASH